MEDTTIEDVLKTVQNYYAQKDYNKALEVLNAHKSSLPEGIWHFNVGTIQAKLENFPLARFHFLMADKEGFTTKEVVHNRKLTEEKLNLDKAENPTSGSDYFYKYSLVGSEGFFTTLALLLIIVGLIVRWKKAAMGVTLLFFMLALGVFGLKWWISSLDSRIVLEAQQIFEGPSVIFPSSDELPPGVMVLTKTKGEWVKVYYPSRFAGWIRNKGLKELK